MRKLLISLWWWIGKWLLEESSAWLKTHPDATLTNAQQRVMLLAEIFWLLTPLDKTLFFGWLWTIYGTERLKEEFVKAAYCSEHESVVKGIEPLAHAFGFQGRQPDKRGSIP